MNIFKKIFRKKSEDEKRALSALKAQESKKVSVEGYCTYLHPEIDAKGYLRYVQKIVLDIPIDEKTQAPSHFWDIFYQKYRDGMEPFNFKDYWIMYIDPIPAISKLSADALYALKLEFMNLCKNEEMPVRHGELYTWKAEWDFFWQEFCNRSHPGYIRTKSPYEILKVREDCPFEVVEKIYNKLKSEIGEPHTTEVTKMLEEATKAFEEIKASK